MLDTVTAYSFTNSCMSNTPYGGYVYMKRTGEGLKGRW